MAFEWEEDSGREYSPFGNVAPVRDENAESISVPRSRVMLWRHAPELFKRLQKFWSIAIKFVRFVYFLYG